MVVTKNLLGRDGVSAWIEPPVWGMIHLAALPGSPAYEGDPKPGIERALRDAEALVGAGYRGVVVENYGDLPFFRDRVPAVTVAALTRAVGAVRDRWPDLRVAVNCLRNDAAAALSIAAVTQADAIRVNVHTGAAVTDQGLLQGRAAQTLRLRAQLGADAVRIFADLAVKHSAPLGERPLAEEAEDARQRGLADVLLLTGSGTGHAADLDQVEAVRAGARDAPIFVASGVDLDSAPRWAERVDGAIVGSAIMNEGRAGAGVDPRRAERLLEAWTKGS